MSAMLDHINHVADELLAISGKLQTLANELKLSAEINAPPPPSPATDPILEAWSSELSLYSCRKHQLRDIVAKYGVDVTEAWYKRHGYNERTCRQWTNKRAHELGIEPLKPQLGGPGHADRKGITGEHVLWMILLANPGLTAAQLTERFVSWPTPSGRPFAALTALTQAGKSIRKGLVARVGNSKTGQFYLMTKGERAARALMKPVSKRRRRLLPHEIRGPLAGQFQ